MNDDDDDDDDDDDGDILANNSDSGEMPRQGFASYKHLMLPVVRCVNLTTATLKKPLITIFNEFKRNFSHS